MITIIKEGTKKEATCNKCGCVFSYENEDIQHAGSELMRIGHPTTYEKEFIECPQCKYRITLKATR